MENIATGVELLDADLRESLLRPRQPLGVGPAARIDHVGVGRQAFAPADQVVLQEVEGPVVLERFLELVAREQVIEIA